MPFERSYLFLDTSVYVKEAYRFRVKSLGKLVDLSRSDELRLVVPEIIKREVEYRLREAAAEHVGKIEAALNSNIIGLIKDEDKKRFGLDAELDKETLVASITETWDSYIASCNAESADLSMIDLPSVVAAYFDAKPPFEKGIKRNEFPDAFAVSSMQTFSNKNPHRVIYVVSRDKGLLEAFKNDSRFRCHEELSEIIDEYNQHTEALSPAAHNLMEKNLDWISDVVSETLRANRHLYAPKYSDEKIHVENVAVDFGKVNLVEIGLDHALFDIGLSYHVEAEVTELVPIGYDDLDWDVVNRHFDGVITAYVQVISNTDFSELIEIASVEF